MAQRGFRESASVAHRAVAAARALVPVQCAGCGLEDVRWCGECAAVWWDEPWRSEEGAGRLDVLGRAPLPVWSIAPLVGSAHGMVAAWKDGARRDLDVFFADAMQRSASSVGPAVVPVGARVAVVPAPSRPRSIRRRGEDLPVLLAAGVARGLAASGTSASVARVLSMHNGEARGSGVRDRWRQARGAVRVNAAVPSLPIVVVDDVLTTGATIAAVVEALENNGGAVVAAMTLAATER